MVGNSIAYQLLLQSHPDITVALINSTYPVLKVIVDVPQNNYMYRIICIKFVTRCNRICKVQPSGFMMITWSSSMQH